MPSLDELQLIEDAYNRPIEKPDRGLLDEFTTGIKRGAIGLKGDAYAIGGIAGKALTGEVPEWAITGMEEAQKQAIPYQASVEHFDEAIESPGKFAQFVAGQAGQLSTTMLTALGGGVVGLGLKTAAKGIASRMFGKVLGEEAAVTWATENAAAGAAKGLGPQDLLKEGIGRANRALSERSFQTGVFGANWGMEAGDIAGEMYERTKDINPTAALTGGAIAAALETVADIALLKRAGMLRSESVFNHLPDATKAVAASQVPDSFLRRVATGALKQNLIEGTTEGAQTVIEKLSVAYHDPSLDPFSRESLREVVTASAAGAIMGVFTGGVSGALSKGTTPQVDLLKQGPETLHYQNYKGPQPDAEKNPAIAAKIQLSIDKLDKYYNLSDEEKSMYASAAAFKFAPGVTEDVAKQKWLLQSNIPVNQINDKIEEIWAGADAVKTSKLMEKYLNDPEVAQGVEQMLTQINQAKMHRAMGALATQVSAPVEQAIPQGMLQPMGAPQMAQNFSVPLTNPPVPVGDVQTRRVAQPDFIVGPSGETFQGPYSAIPEQPLGMRPEEILSSQQNMNLQKARNVKMGNVNMSAMATELPPAQAATYLNNTAQLEHTPQLNPTDVNEKFATPQASPWKKQEEPPKQKKARKKAEPKTEAPKKKTGTKKEEELKEKLKKKKEQNEAPKAEAPKTEAPKTETPKRKRKTTADIYAELAENAGANAIASAAKGAKALNRLFTKVLPKNSLEANRFINLSKEDYDLYKADFKEAWTHVKNMGWSLAEFVKYTIKSWKETSYDRLSATFANSKIKFEDMSEADQNHLIQQDAVRGGTLLQAFVRDLERRADKEYEAIKAVEKAAYQKSMKRAKGLYKNHPDKLKKFKYELEKKIVDKLHDERSRIYRFKDNLYPSDFFPEEDVSYDESKRGPKPEKSDKSEFASKPVTQAKKITIADQVEKMKEKRGVPEVRTGQGETRPDTEAYGKSPIQKKKEREQKYEAQKPTKLEEGAEPAQVSDVKTLSFDKTVRELTEWLIETDKTMEEIERDKANEIYFPRDTRVKKAETEIGVNKKLAEKLNLLYSAAKETGILPPLDEQQALIREVVADMNRSQDLRKGLSTSDKNGLLKELGIVDDRFDIKLIRQYTEKLEKGERITQWTKGDILIRDKEGTVVKVLPGTLLDDKKVKALLEDFDKVDEIYAKKGFPALPAPHIALPLSELYNEGYTIEQAKDNKAVEGLASTEVEVKKAKTTDEVLADILGEDESVPTNTDDVLAQILGEEEVEPEAIKTKITKSLDKITKEEYKRDKARVVSTETLKLLTKLFKNEKHLWAEARTATANFVIEYLELSHGNYAGKQSQINKAILTFGKDVLMLRKARTTEQIKTVQDSILKRAYDAFGNIGKQMKNNPDAQLTPIVASVSQFGKQPVSDVSRALESENKADLVKGINDALSEGYSKVVIRQSIANDLLYRMSEYKADELERAVNAWEKMKPTLEGMLGSSRYDFPITPTLLKQIESVFNTVIGKDSWAMSLVPSMAHDESAVKLHGYVSAEQATKQGSGVAGRTTMWQGPFGDHMAFIELATALDWRSYGIEDPKASILRTTWHEAAHPAIKVLQLVDPVGYKLLEEKVSSLSRVGNIRADASTEEKMAEYVALIATGERKLLSVADKTILERIVDLLQKVKDAVYKMVDQFKNNGYYSKKYTADDIVTDILNGGYQLRLVKGKELITTQNLRLMEKASQEAYDSVAKAGGKSAFVNFLNRHFRLPRFFADTNPTFKVIYDLATKAMEHAEELKHKYFQVTANWKRDPLASYGYILKRDYNDIWKKEPEFAKAVLKALKAQYDPNPQAVANAIQELRDKGWADRAQRIMEDIEGKKTAVIAANKTHEVLQLPPEERKRVFEVGFVSDAHNQIFTPQELAAGTAVRDGAIITFPSLSQKQVEAYYAVRRTFNNALQDYLNGLREAFYLAMDDTATHGRKGYLLDSVRELMALRKQLKLDKLTGNRKIAADLQFRQAVKDYYGDGEYAMTEDQQKTFDQLVGAATAHMKRIDELEKKLEAVKYYMPRVRGKGRYAVFVYDNDMDAGNNLVMQKHTDPALKSMEERQARKMIDEFRAGKYSDKDRYKIVTRLLPETAESFQGLLKWSVIESTIENAKNRMAEKKQFDVDVLDEFSSAIAEAVDTELNSMSKAKSKMIARNERLIEGYVTEDAQVIMFDYLNAIANEIARIQFSIPAHKALSTIDPKKDAVQFDNSAKFIQHILTPQSGADRVAGQLRSWAFLYYLGLNVKSAMIQLTQSYVTGWPVLSYIMKREGLEGSAVAIQTKAIKDAMGYYAYRMGVAKTHNLTSGEVALLDEAFNKGITEAQFMNQQRDDIAAASSSRGKRFEAMMNRFMNFTSHPFSDMEIVNRTGGYLAMYRASRKEGLGVEYRKDLAKEFVERTHFVFGKKNVPFMMMGNQLVHSGLKTGYTFRNFQHNYFETMYALWNLAETKEMKKAAVTAYGQSLVSMMMFAGIMGIPFADDLADWFERKTGTPLRTKVKHALVGQNKFLERLFEGGVPNALLSTNISGSLYMGGPEGIGGAVFGVFGGFYDRAKYAAEAMSARNYYRMIEETSPAFLQSPMKAYRLATEGQTSPAGKEKLDELGKPRKLAGMEAVLQAFGFRPGSLASTQTEARTAQNIENAFNERRKDMAGLYRTAQHSSDAERAAGIRKDLDKLITDYNIAATKYKQPKVTYQSLLRAAKPSQSKTAQAINSEQ